MIVVIKHTKPPCRQNDPIMFYMDNYLAND